MSEDQPIYEPPQEDKPSMKVAPAAPEKRRASRSAFAPIVLIAAGIVFLLNNLGVVGVLDWPAALRFWPLALIFLGLNVLVVQLRPPAGTILSALVGLAAVAVFGTLLLRGAPDGVLRSLGVPDGPDLKEETFALTPGAAETAGVTLHLSNYPSRIAAGNGDHVVGGTIWTSTGVDMKPSGAGDDRVEVSVGELPGGMVLNPLSWISAPDEGYTWEIDLTPDLPLDLHLDAGNGPVTADLAALTLASLRLDASNGRFTAGLPDGDYDVRMESGNGGVELALPAAGSQTVRLDGGNGRIEISLPQGVEARVEYDTGNGGLTVDGRFERVQGDRDEGVYETAGYSAGGEGVVLIIETGNGSVEID